MRKTAILFIILSFLFCFYGCKQENAYFGYVSELNQDIYVGTVGETTLTAVYGFKESPYINDGAVGKKIYCLTFKLNVIPDEIKRTVKCTFNGKEFSADFAVDAVTSEYKARIETEKEQGDFTAEFVCGSEITTFNMTSALPENCLNANGALSALQAEQQALLDAYTVDGIFKAELYMRVIMRNDYPYWYVGIASGNGALQALLLDGITGKALAIREIF